MTQHGYLVALLNGALHAIGITALALQYTSACARDSSPAYVDVPTSLGLLIAAKTRSHAFELCSCYHHSAPKLATICQSFQTAPSTTLSKTSALGLLTMERLLRS